MTDSVHRAAMAVASGFVAMLIVGCGGADRQPASAANGAEPTESAQVASVPAPVGRVPITIEGGTPGEQAALEAILIGMREPAGIDTVEIGLPPKSFDQTDLGTTVRRFPEGSVWLRFIGKPSGDLDTAAADWSAQVAAGAAQAEFPGIDGHAVVGRTIMVGETSYDAATDGWEKEDSGFTLDDATASATATTAEEQAGVTVTRLTILHAVGPVVIVEGTVTDATDLGKARGGIDGLEGRLLILRDAKGAVVAVSGYAGRQHSGVGFGFPTLDGGSFDPIPPTRLSG